MEAIHQFGTNLVAFQPAMGERRWYIIICYLATDDTSTIDSPVIALREHPQGSELLVVGEFNYDLARAKEAGWYKEIATALKETGLEDMSAHFILH